MSEAQGLAPARETRPVTVKRALLNALQALAANAEHHLPGSNPVWDDLMSVLALLKRFHPEMLELEIER
jgi:hypothetical protein